MGGGRNKGGDRKPPIAARLSPEARVTPRLHYRDPRLTGQRVNESFCFTVICGAPLSFSRPPGRGQLTATVCPDGQTSRGAQTPIADQGRRFFVQGLRRYAVRFGASYPSSIARFHWQEGNRSLPTHFRQRGFVTRCPESGYAPDVRARHYRSSHHPHLARRLGRQSPDPPGRDLPSPLRGSASRCLGQRQCDRPVHGRHVDSDGVRAPRLGGQIAIGDQVHAAPDGIIAG